MLTRNPLDVARERGGQLRAEAASERLRGPSRTRLVLAASLRHAADRLDPAPLRHASALRPAAQVRGR